MKRYWVYGYLLAYLGSQIHEAMHWSIACILGVSSTVGMIGLNVPESTPPLKFILIASAGGLVTILYTVVGILLYRSQKLFVKQLGFILVFITAIGRILYEISSPFAGATDETGIAIRLGIPDWTLRLPLTLLCLISLLYVIWRNDTALRAPCKLILIFTSLVVSLIQVLLMSSLLNALQNESWLFAPVWQGYVPVLALVNLIYVAIFALAIRLDGRLSNLVNA